MTIIPIVSVERSNCRKRRRDSLAGAAAAVEAALGAVAVLVQVMIVAIDVSAVEVVVGQGGAQQQPEETSDTPSVFGL